MNDATAIAFCAGGSSGSGANHSVTGMATHKIRPISVRHENLAPSDAASGSTGFTIAANAACDCSSIVHYPLILTTILTTGFGLTHRGFFPTSLRQLGGQRRSIRRPAETR